VTASGHSTTSRVASLYLTSYDLEPPLAPRRCAILRRARYGARDDFALVAVDPQFEAGELRRGQPVRVVAVASRHQGYSLFPITEWPLHVYVCVPEDGQSEWPMEPHTPLPKLTIVIWGLLHRTRPPGAD
jgi:hypothetical protein